MLSELLLVLLSEPISVPVPAQLFISEKDKTKIPASGRDFFRAKDIKAQAIVLGLLFRSKESTKGQEL